MTDALVPLINCRRCSRSAVPQDQRSAHLCVDCAKAENSRVSYYRQHQGDWMVISKESGLDVWEQQPGETQWEFTVWTAYRDTYPGKKPSYTSVARQLDTTYEAVKKIAARWTFQTRMQAWMKHCDDITLVQRTNEILEMNKEHVDMAAALRQKLKIAIAKIDPVAMRPSEISSLLKTMAELERQARIDTIAQEEIKHDLMRDDDNPSLRKSVTKSSDLKEVIGVLASAGVLGDITQIGVRNVKTDTTEVVLRDSSGAESRAKIGE